MSEDGRHYHWPETPEDFRLLHLAAAERYLNAAEIGYGTETEQSVREGMLAAEIAKLRLAMAAQAEHLAVLHG